MTIMAPSDEVELQHMIATSLSINDSPSVVRFPRGNGVGMETLNEMFGYGMTAMPKRGRVLPIGKGRIIRRKAAVLATSDSPSVAILSIGTRLLDSVTAAIQLESQGVPVTVADARFMKPLDRELIRELVGEHQIVITIEEGSIGGFGDHVLHFLALEGYLDTGYIKFRPMCLPDRYIEQGSQAEQYDEAGLSASHIVATTMKLIGRSSDLLNQSSPSESTSSSSL
jgi:1-deoxy-D-xylulose-5-phosphate synthase